MFEVRVNGHPLKTPTGHLFQVPTLALAQAIEEEWEKDSSPHFRQKPLTALTATALDKITPLRDSYIKSVLQIISTDSLLFWEKNSSSLVKLQEEKWSPFFKQVNSLLELTLKPTFSLSAPSLSSKEEKKIEVFLEGKTNFELAGFSYLLTLTSSFCLSYLLLENLVSAENAWQAALLHEHTQRRFWGEDEDVLLQEKNKYEELLETVRFLKLLS